MANNKECFCNHCNKETTFYLESDLIWYCDECDNPLDSFPIMDDDELESELVEFEENYGEAVYCRTCGNFVLLEDILNEPICPYCTDELDIELERKGYTYDSDSDSYIKDRE